MPTIKIGKTNKRVNSTSQTFASSTSLSCVLKEPCSMQNPIFQVQGLTKGALYNFAEFEGRYYWVDDVTYLTNNIQEVECHLDVLATWKTAIGNMDVLAAYTDSAHRNLNVDDPRMKPEIQPTYSTPLITVEKAFHDDVTFIAPSASGVVDGGTVIVRISCIPDQTDYGGADTGVMTFAMTPDSFNHCLSDLSTILLNLVPATQGWSWTDIEEIIHEVNQFFAKLYGALGGGSSWTDNILSAIYVPIDISCYASHYEQAFAAGADIYIGSVPATIPDPFYQINSSGVFLNCARTLDIPWWDGTHAGGQPSFGPPRYLRAPKYCALQAQLPGTYFDIDTSDLKDQDKFGYYSCINIATGEWSCKLVEQRGDTNEILGSSSGNISMDMMGLVGSGETKGGIVGNMVGRIAGSAVSIGIPEAGAASAGLGGFVKDALGMGGNVGAASGAMSAGGTELYLIEPATTTALGKVVIRCIQWIPACYSDLDDFYDEYGYPSDRWMKINTNSGFIAGRVMSIKNAVGANAQNKQEINNYILNGFYYE